jgi:hypothetical protein
MDPAPGLGFASALFERTGFGDRWAYHDAHTATWHGPAAAEISTTAARADALLNLAGFTQSGRGSRMNSSSPRYAAHREMAREVARSYFDSQTVLRSSSSAGLVP